MSIAKYRARMAVWCVIIVASLFAALPCEAATIVYTDRSLWEAAVGIFSTEDFSSVADTGLLAANTDHVFGLLTFSFTGNSGGGEAPNVGGNVFHGNANKASIGGGVTQPGPNTFAFPYSVVAWGADFVSTTTGALLEVTMAGETVAFIDYLTPPGDGFLGIIGDTPFSQISLSGGETTIYDNELFSMDNVSFGAEATQVPVSSALPLLGLGLAAIAGRRRLQRRT